MDRTEFLQKLKEALENDLTGGIVQEQLSYYNTYITEEASKGRSEEEVIAELGDPWVLAKTVSDSVEMQGETYGSNTVGSGETSHTEGGSYTEQQEYHRQEQYHGEDSYGSSNSFGFSSWKLILLLVMVILVIVLVITAIAGIIKTFWPILFPVLVIAIIIRLLKR